MKFLHVTNAETNRNVYIPVERISSIRYPVGDNETTLITWSETDSVSQVENFKECPRDFRFVEI